MDRIYRIRQGMGGRYALERDGGLYWLEGHVFGDYHIGMLIEETGLRFAPPVQPSKIIAIGLNYKDHAAEMNKALAGRAARLLEAVLVGHRSRGCDSYSVVGRPHRL